MDDDDDEMIENINEMLHTSKYQLTIVICNRRCNTPHPGALVHTATDNLAAVWRKSDGDDTAGTFKLRQPTAGHSIPHTDAVVAATDNLAAIGRKRNRKYASCMTIQLRQLAAARCVPDADAFVLTATDNLSTVR